MLQLLAVAAPSSLAPFNVARRLPLPLCTDQASVLWDPLLGCGKEDLPR